LSAEGSGVRWYYRPVSVLAALLVAGPLAIPLVCLSPSFRLWQKTLIIIAVAAAAIWALKSAAGIYNMLLADLRELEAAMPR